MPDNEEQAQAPETKGAAVQIGVDWDNGIVVLTAHVEGLEAPVALQIPVDVYVQSAMALGMQVVQRMNANQVKRSGLVLARPGDLPPNIKLN